MSPADPTELADAAKPRLASIQLCRAGAAWLVVLYHLAKLGDYRWSTSAGRPNVLRWFESFGFAGVDLFFVISGAVMMFTCWTRFGDARHAVPFLRRRALRIYPLYWLCTAAVLAIAWLAPQFVPAEKTDPWFIVKSLALWPQREMPVVTVGWTLTYEVCFYLAFAGLIALPRRLALPALAAWAIAIAATGALASEATNKALGVPAIFPPLAPLALEFIAGCVVGWFLGRGVIAVPRVLLLAGLVLFVGAGAWCGSSDDGFASGWLRLAVFGVGSALIVYGAAGHELAGATDPPRALTFWGDASYSLYLTHGYVIQALGLLIPTSPSAESPAIKLSLAIAILAACGAVAAVVHLAVERPLLAWARRLHPRRVASAGNSDAPAHALLTPDS